MAGTADRSVTARAFGFLVDVFGTPKCRFWLLAQRVLLLEHSAELFWVDVWLGRLKVATARAQGGFQNSILLVRSESRTCTDETKMRDVQCCGDWQTAGGLAC
jgi:hypothetical protein